MKLMRITTFLLFVFCLQTFAQNGPPPMALPQASPAASVSQTVGITNISVDYSRPALRDRDVLGTIVAYDQIWRAGANLNTTISFDNAIKIDGKDVAAGKYGLHIIPKKDEDWIIILSEDNNSWGSFFYDEKRDVIRTKGKYTKLTEKQERLTYDFENISNSSADIFAAWGDFKVSFTIDANSSEVVMDYIENDYLKNIAGFFWQSFNNSAMYCFNNNTNLDKGMEWSERAISNNKNFTTLSTKSLLLRRMGKEDEAKKVLDEAMPMASENEINLYGYSLLYGLEDVDGAITMFKKNVKDYPDSWNVYDSLAEGLAQKGKKKDAIKYYKQALAKAPDQQKSRIEGLIKGLEG